MSITPDQNRLLHAAKRQLGLTDDSWRDLLRAEAGVESSKFLDNRGVNRVLKRLRRAGFINTAHRPAPRRNRDSAALITAEQQLLIDDLYVEVGIPKGERQMGFSKKQCRKSFPQTRLDAEKIIEGLKAILLRRIDVMAPAEMELLVHTSPRHVYLTFPPLYQRFSSRLNAAAVEIR